MSDQITVRVDSIIVGERYRKDLGDIAGLADSIANNVGLLLHRIVVRRVAQEWHLVAGARRLAAAKALGWETVPVEAHLDMDDETALRAEFAENVHRKDFTWIEAVAIKRVLEPLERMAAKERQRVAGPQAGKGTKRSATGKLPTAVKGRAADKAAKAAGKKRRTLEKAEAVVVAFEAEPERFGDLVERLEEPDAPVEIIHRELKQRQARAAYEERAEAGCTIDDLEKLAASGKKFPVIYVDVPWEYVTYSGKGKQRSAERHYDTMPLDEIKAMAPTIRSLAAKDCALLFWVTWPNYTAAIEILRAWGFVLGNDDTTGAFVWVKTKPKYGTPDLEDLKPEHLHVGMGHSTRSNTEYVLLAKLGSPQQLANDVHQVVIAPRPRKPSEHSEKPEEVRRRIERLYAGPYLELFGRKLVDGWTVWGDEISRADFPQDDGKRAAA